MFGLDDLDVFNVFNVLYVLDVLDVLDLLDLAKICSEKMIFYSPYIGVEMLSLIHISEPTRPY